MIVPICATCQQPAAHLIDGRCWYCWTEQRAQQVALADGCIVAARQIQSEELALERLRIERRGQP